MIAESGVLQFGDGSTTSVGKLLAFRRPLKAVGADLGREIVVGDGEHVDEEGPQAGVVDRHGFVDDLRAEAADEEQVVGHHGGGQREGDLLSRSSVEIGITAKLGKILI